MKLLSTYRPSVPAVATQDTARAEARTEPPATARAPARRPRLPRDSTVQFNTSPAELYIHMTITKMEHIEALMEALNTFAPQLEYARRREDD
jgi:hypothetical protein